MILVSFFRKYSWVLLCKLFRRAPRLIVAGGEAARHNPDSYVGTGARIWIFRGALSVEMQGNDQPVRERL